MSKLELEFELLWQALGGKPPDAKEFKFHPVRKWRFDYAWVKQKVAVEIEGGSWVGGRHNRARGFAKDCEKYNAAASQGWLVFRLTGDMLTEEHLQPIIDIVKERTNE